MEALEELEETRRAGPADVPAVPRGTASNEMCNFLILNISSLQLIPVTIIAYRSQYGSASPTAVVGPAIVATALNTVLAILFCKFMTKQSGSYSRLTVSLKRSCISSTTGKFPACCSAQQKQGTFWNLLQCIRFYTAAIM